MKPILSNFYYVSNNTDIYDGLSCEDRLRRIREAKLLVTDLIEVATDRSIELNDMEIQLLGSYFNLKYY
jgi:hypothetical protein